MTGLLERRRALVLALVVVTSLVIAACGDDEPGDAGATVATPNPSDATTSDGAPADDAASDGAGGEATPVDTTPAAPTSPPEEAPPADVPGGGDALVNLDATREAIGIELLVLDPPTEDGSHPVLAWQPVDGAVSYWLVVHDADGRPYWAWSGAATSVRLGGGDRADTNQTAALHDAMTWTVLALDADGTPLALSGEGTVEPGTPG